MERFPTNRLVGFAIYPQYGEGSTANTTSPTERGRGCDNLKELLLPGKHVFLPWTALPVLDDLSKSFCCSLNVGLPVKDSRSYFASARSRQVLETGAQLEIQRENNNSNLPQHIRTARADFEGEPRFVLVPYSVFRQQHTREKVT